MKVKKRKKTSRLRGSRTFGWGFRQRHRGHGCKGGSGMAGTGKRADHKKQKALMMAKKAGAKSYFGKRGFTSRKTEKNRTNQINLGDIQKNYLDGDKIKIDLKDYKILGVGGGFKAEIVAKAASKAAIEKMKKAGGKIVLPLPAVEDKKKSEKEKAKQCRSK